MPSKACSSSVVGVEAFGVEIEVRAGWGNTDRIAWSDCRTPRSKRVTWPRVATIGGKVSEQLYSLLNGKQKLKTSCKSRTEIAPAIRPEAC
jgi:hypothetical protein